MKWRITLSVLALLLALCACSAPAQPATGPSAQSISEPTQIQSGWLTTQDGIYYLQEDGSLHTGWLELSEGTYYLNEDGSLHTGWLERAEGTYYLSDTGAIHTGWLELEDGTYYLNEDGTVYTGWLESEKGRYYFLNGALHTGWLDTADGHWYLDENGQTVTGWLELDGKRYYLNEDGTTCTGWLELDGTQYYFRSDGSMARGQVEIDGINHFFTSAGTPILVVNPWNSVPQGYEPDLVEVSYYYSTAETYVDRSCFDALMEMLKDCNANSGARVCVVSGYRSYEEQSWNYRRKVNEYLYWGYSQAEAEAKAATTVAVPGTSEHHLGLAVDIIDTRLWELTESQADLAGQQWLMEHCWEYGFILRYPGDKTDITGIIYEPWHYRYVGTDVAAEIHEVGLTLEEYIANLS